MRRSVIKSLTASEEEVQRTFIKADLHFKDRKVLVIDVNDTPGECVRAARALVDGDVEFDTSNLLGKKSEKLRFVFGVDDVEKAKKAAKTLPVWSSNKASRSHIRTITMKDWPGLLREGLAFLVLIPDVLQDDLPVAPQV